MQSKNFIFILKPIIFMCNIFKVNSTHVLNLTANANLYGIGTSSAMSAVHIPTPVYDRSEFVFHETVLI